MDILIENFVSTHYIDELATDIFTFFDIAYSYNFIDCESPFINIIMSADMHDTQQITTTFLNTILDQQDYIFNEHLIKINTDQSIAVRNTVLKCLLDIQKLETYIEIDSLIQNDNDPEHVLATVCSILTNIDIPVFLDVIENFDSLAAANLKIYVYKQSLLRDSTIVGYTLIGQHIVYNMRSFIKFTNRDDLIGKLLLENGSILDQDYEKYLVSFNPIDIVTDATVDDMALNILSFIYMTDNGIQRPIEAYRAISSIFFDDIILFNKVESAIVELTSDFNSYKEIENEKTRLFQARNNK